MSASATALPMSPAQSRQRWLMLGLVWAMYACFGIATGSTAPLVEPIVKDLGLSYSEMGVIMGAWQLAYIGTAYPMGVLIDRLGVRTSLGVGILVIAASLVLRAMAGNFLTLFLAVALFGVGGPIISIGAPKVVAQWFQGNQRGLAAGIYATGPVGGAALALATAGSVIMPMTGSWRGVPLVFAGIALAVAAAWWLLARDAPASNTSGATSGTQAEAVKGPPLLSIHNVQLLLVMAAMTFTVNHGLSNWSPTLLRESGMSLAQAGAWTAFATALGATGLLFIPSLARHGRRVLTLSLLLALTAISGVGLALGDGPVLLGSLTLSAMARSPLMPVLTLVLMETPGIGAARMGTAGGLFFAVAEVGGFGGPFLLGYLRDTTGSLTTGALTLAGVSLALLLVVLFIKEGRQETG